MKTQRLLPASFELFIEQHPLLKGALQITFIGVVWEIAVLLVDNFRLPVSSGVLGLFLMLGLLFSGLVKLSWVKMGSKLVLGELVLMFIPLMMSLTQYKQLFLSEGWQLLVTIIFSTAMVMLSSALTFMLGNRIQRRLHRRRRHRQSNNQVNHQSTHQSKTR